MPSVRLLVVGDVVLDEYVRGDVERVSPEAPVPVVHVRDETFACSGRRGQRRAQHRRPRRAGRRLLAVVGDDEAGDRLDRLCSRTLGVDASNLAVSKGRPTTRKTRVVARSQQVVRDSTVRCSRAARLTTSRGGWRRRSGRTCRDRGSTASFVEDYGKGLLSERFATA